jgi:hypothetical protein
LPLTCAIGVTVLSSSVVPKQIPRTEVEPAGDDSERRYTADPEEAAFIAEEALAPLADVRAGALAPGPHADPSPSRVGSILLRSSDG